MISIEPSRICFNEKGRLMLERKRERVSLATEKNTVDAHIRSMDCAACEMAFAMILDKDFLYFRTAETVDFSLEF